MGATCPSVGAPRPHPAVTSVAAFGIETKSNKTQTVLDHGSMEAHHPRFRKLRQEDWEFKASLGSFVRPISSFKKKKKKSKRLEVQLSGRTLA